MGSQSLWQVGHRCEALQPPLMQSRKNLSRAICRFTAARKKLNKFILSERQQVYRWFHRYLYSIISATQP